jgi:hypothetical protein
LATKKPKKQYIFFILKKKSPFGENSSPKKKKKKKNSYLPHFILFWGCWGQGFFLEIFLCGNIHGQFKKIFSINWQQYFYKKNCPNNIFKSDGILPSN